MSEYYEKNKTERKFEKKKRLEDIGWQRNNPGINNLFINTFINTVKLVICSRLFGYSKKL